MGFVEEGDYIFDDGITKGFGYGAVAVARRDEIMRVAFHAERTMVY